MFALSFRSCLRFTLLGGLGVAASACTHAGDGSNVSLEQSVSSRNAKMMALAPERARNRRARAMAALPDEAVAWVRDHEYVNGVRQDVLLGGAARGMQNSITILARTSRAATLDEQVPIFKPTEAGIRSEIGGQFPRLRMQVAERESSNTYGPYGLALGRDGDVRCAYMWQWIDANRLPADSGVSGPISIRVRLCKAGTTFDAMAAQMDHLTIDGAASSDRVALNEPIQIVQAPSQALDPARVRHKPAHRLAAAHRPRQVAAGQVAAGQDAPAPAPAPVAAGPRYMSPSTNGTPAPAPAMPATPAVATQLSGDLPAEAYRGPLTTKTATTKYY